MRLGADVRGFRIHLGDANETSALTQGQHGAYILLMQHYYAKGRLPVDEAQLNAIAKAHTAAEKANVQAVIAAVFVRDRHSYRHRKVDAELRHAERRRDTARQNGAHGGRPGVKDDQPPGFQQPEQQLPPAETAADAAAGPSPPPPPAEAEAAPPPAQLPEDLPPPPPLQLEPPPPPGARKAKTAVADLPADQEPPYSPEFLEFWKAYPCKQKKVMAWKRWQAMKIQPHQAARIIEDVRTRCASDGLWLTGFVPHPSTYLNQRRWVDPVADRPSGNRQNGRRDRAETEKANEETVLRWAERGEKQR